jgi:sugar phosphate isomerase/epimerase
MSTTRSAVVDTVERRRTEDVTPVTIAADDLESTAPEYLRDLKYELSSEGYVPARVEADACFAEDCSLATQEEVERLRDVIRAAAFLGVSTLAIGVDEVADREKVEPALEACAERARREGVSLSVDGPLDVSA